MQAQVDVTVATHRGAGFFAEFGKVIQNIIHYEPEGIHTLKVDWTNQFFPFKNSTEENGWNLYFEPVVTENQPEKTTGVIKQVKNTAKHELHGQNCVGHWVKYDENLPYRLFVHEKIMKYIHIKPHIIQLVDDFYEKHMKDNLCVGIHIRFANAHIAEAPKGHPSLDDYCKEVDSLLKEHSTKRIKIFLASDSHAVIKHFKQRYNNKLLYLDTYRAQEKEDPSLIYEKAKYYTTHPEEWAKEKPGYNGGLGVLMDCLLLARCNFFIHITSNVASYVCFFNPYIKSIFLPKNITFSPCRFRNDKDIVNPFLKPGLAA